MSIVLLLISDGRDEYLEQTRASAAEKLPPFDHVIHVDDREHRLGFAGAIQEGWRRVLETDAEFVFHLEQDFTFREYVPVDIMAAVLEDQRDLVQLALLRGPVNAAEHAAGGIIEQRPQEYRAVSDHLGRRWREHRLFFTTNPSLYPRWIVERGWPSGPQSEGRFGLELFRANPRLRAAFWGDRVLVDHIGDVRAGTGY